MLFYANSLFIRFFFVSLQPKAASTGYASAIQVNLIALGLHRPCPENKKITIMTQILVTLNEDATTLHVRKAIELLRGVASVKVFKGNAEKLAEKRRQEAYVKESLTRAFDEVKRARRGEHKMMTDEEFMAELKAEGIA